MLTGAANETIYYSSVFRHGVDEKRRVQIPAKWRPLDPNVELSLILWPHGNMNEACLLVLPPTEWKSLADKLKVMPFMDSKATVLRRLMGTKSAQVALDRAGRICLPEEFAAAIGIVNEAVLVGLVDRFQIWSPERHQIVSAEDEAMANEVYQLLS
jgi:MraZ protein